MPTSNFQQIRLLDLDCCFKFTNLMANSADPDQLASLEANIWIYTVCKGWVHSGSAGQGLKLCHLTLHVILCLSVGWENDHNLGLRTVSFNP